MTELHTTKAIIEYLNFSGAAVWMNEISGMPSNSSPTGRRRLRGGRGSADIVGTLKGGRACFIECKDESLRKKVTTIWEYWQKHDTFPVHLYDISSKENHHLAEQCNFLSWQKKAGAFVMFAFALLDVETQLSGERKG